MEVAAFLILVPVLLAVMAYLWSRRHLYVLAAHLPGPPALPLFGNGLMFLCKKEDILGVIMKVTESYPSPMRLWLGPKLVLFVKDPDQLQIIMQSSKMSTKSYIYSFLEPFLGKGLFTSNGGTHKNHRKLLQSLFGQRVLDGYSHLFRKHAVKFVDRVHRHVDGPKFDILLYLHDSAFEATMDILLEDKNDHSIDYQDVPKYIRRFYDLFFNRVLSFWLHSDIIYKRTNFYKEQERMTKMATEMTQDIANTRIPEIQNRLENKPDINANCESRTPSVLEMMMEMVNENPNCLSEQEFTDHMMTFVATSQDTQSSAIAFTFMMLGLHPEIQNKVVEELNEVLDGRENLDFNDVNKLKYLEMCIKESIRLFPLGPFLLRDSTDNFQLDKWLIPKNCTLVLGIYNVHKNQKFWERPDEFYPEHFTSEQISNRHPYAFLPFSAGPRRCVAQQYSYANMKIIIGTVLQNYILEAEGTLKDIKLMTDVSIRPIKGYMVKIKKRR